MSEHPAVEHLSCRFSYVLRGDGPPVLLIQGAGVHILEAHLAHAEAKPAIENLAR